MAIFCYFCRISQLFSIINPIYMKKFLLLAIAAASSMAVWAADAKWTASVNNIFKDNKAVLSGVVTVDASGNSYAAGAYNQDVTINGKDFSAIGNSAYIAKYDATGSAKWTINFEGAATVSSMTTDADGNLYVAGTLADEVILGSTDDKTATIKGLFVDGTPSKKMQASFIAKYSAAGVLLAQTTFYSEEFPDALTADIPNEADNAYFRITDIKASGNKIYAVAKYIGNAKHGNATFEGYYNSVWFGMMINDLQSTAVFSLSAELDNCQIVASCSTGENLATEEGQYEAGPAAITVAGDKVYAAFTASGPCVVKVGQTSNKIEKDASTASVSFVSTDGAFSSYTIANADVAQIKDFGAYALNADGTNLEYVGNQLTTEGDDEKKMYQLAFYSLNPTDLKRIDAETNCLETTDNGQYYYSLTGAVFTNGVWTCSAAGQWASTADGHSNGDFTGTSKCITNHKGFAGTADVAGAYTIGANNNVITYASLDGTGATYAQYASPTSGIDDIVTGDENAPVEYYNLQGIRVSDPTPGMYIMRQGTTTSKVIIR